MELKKLEGGKLVKAVKKELPFSPYMDEPRIRFGTPGSLEGTAATGVQLQNLAMMGIKQPQPERVKAAFREVNDVQYFLMAPTLEKGHDTYPIRWDGLAPRVSGLKDLFQHMSIEMRRDTWYLMNTEMVNDEDLGPALKGDWTHATLAERKERVRKPKAAKSKTQPDKSKPDEKEKEKEKGQGKETESENGSDGAANESA